MIYSDRHVSEFRAILMIVALATILMSGAALAVRKADLEEAVAGLVLGSLLFVLSWWLVPQPLPPVRVPRSPPNPPPRLQMWRRDPPRAPRSRDQ